MPAGKQRLSEIMMYSVSHGEAETKEHYGLTDETWNRYKREYRKQTGDNVETLLQLRARYTEEELSVLSQGVRPPAHNTIIHDFTGASLRFGLMSDNHLGSVYSDPGITKEAIQEFNRQKVDFTAHTGDVVEGMMGRPGDIYELTHIGYKAQRDLSRETLADLQSPLYVISGNHDCLDPETECLTMRGWKKYEELEKKDFILSFDTETGRSVWDPINNILVKKYDGVLLKYEGRRYNFMGTPSHRVLLRKAYTFNIRHGGDGYRNWEYEEAGKAKGGFQLKVGAPTGYGDYQIPDDMIRLVAWLQTDGSVSRDTEQCVGSYCIYQSKDISSILQIIERMGLPYTLSERKRDITSVCGRKLKNPPLSEKCIRFKRESAEKIKEYLYDKSKIPEWLYKISDRQFDIYLEIVKQANGSWHRVGPTKAYAVYGRKEYLDALQILCILHGKRASISMDNRGAFYLNVTPNRDTLELAKIKYEHVPYNGIVWCLSVPKTNFMVRRKGKAYFTGNCSYNSKHGIGANIVEDICSVLPNAKFLGHDEGDIDVLGIKIRLFHGGDGSSYALSYRGQKLIEAINGGNKPAVFCAGHSHKSLYMPAYRNVHYLEAGTLQWQSSWMRGKKLQAHVGFWVVDMVVGNGEVKSFSPKWYPFYK